MPGPTTNEGPDFQANGATLLPSTHSSSHRGGSGRQTEADSRDRDEDRMRKKRTMAKGEDCRRGRMKGYGCGEREVKREQGEKKEERVSEVERETWRAGGRKGNMKEKGKEKRQSSTVFLSPAVTD